MLRETEITRRTEMDSGLQGRTAPEPRRTLLPMCHATAFTVNDAEEIRRAQGLSAEA